jgi:hypothetical protein
VPHAQICLLERPAAEQPRLRSFRLYWPIKKLDPLEIRLKLVLHVQNGPDLMLNALQDQKIPAFAAELG